MEGIVTETRPEDELNSLLDDLRPYKVVFDATRVLKKPSLTTQTITVKLNQNTQLLSYSFNDNTQDIENNGEIIKEKSVYDNVRTVLQNRRKVIEEAAWDDSFKTAKQQLVSYLTAESADRELFLKEFQTFVNQLPQVPSKFIECCRQLTDIDFDNWDIDDAQENDPRAEALSRLHKEIVQTFDSYKQMGNDYMQSKSKSDTKKQQQQQQQQQDDANALEKLPFEDKYPEQSLKIKRIFNILDDLERGPSLDNVITIVSRVLGLSLEAAQKLSDYFNARSLTKKKKIVTEETRHVWYSDEDMNRYGRILQNHGVDFNTQFSNRLTDDTIKTLPGLDSLPENQPRYICYNIGGDTVKDNSGLHWVAIFLVRQQNRVTILYKDSKGDWNNSSDTVAKLFNEHYKNVDFIKQTSVEQSDDSSCGPMTINNLEIMAKLVKQSVDEGKDGVSELIAAFKAIDFTRQDQVTGVRVRHLMQNRSKNTPKSDSSIENLDSIIKKLQLIELTSDYDRKMEIKSLVEKTDNYYNQVADWSVDQLKDWSLQRKGNLNSDDSDELCHAIAVMDRANELASGGHRLRDTQKMAVLIFMRTNSKGHVGQINTGEGKTTIISIVAALKVLTGHKCHVITSNEVLAADGVKDKQLFYGLLEISVADNNSDEKYTDGPRVCYSKDVVYGSITSFQFDWLRDSFEKLNTLDNLDYSRVWVMLDEIDSLLIDQGSNIAKLSGPFPGMESLRYVYINIWLALAKAEDQVANEIVGKLKAKANELSEDELNNYEDTLRESFLDEIKKVIKSQKAELISEKLVARHLLQYASDSVNRWIDHAFTAKYQYNADVEYKLGKDKAGEAIILPVDNQNTGVSMKNTILSNGLHQFLQLKHNLCLTYESLTSCYISNIDYIKKYGSRLTGVTGTLGSEAERKLLGSVFNLDFSIIPPYKPKRFIKFPGRVATDEQWLSYVAIAALGELARRDDLNTERPRSVLIVCASIQDVDRIAVKIEKEANSARLIPRILKYRDEADLEVTKRALQVNDIVVATNLAGRGTDFKTSDELETNGGLHVIVAFLPCNKRVEDQALGRTGRQGNAGSGQIITKLSELQSLGIHYDSNFDKVMHVRDELEARRVNEITESKLVELEFKGELFSRFSTLYSELKETHKVGVGKDVIKWIYVLRDLKERWAFWLESREYTVENIKKLIDNKNSLVDKLLLRDKLTQAVKHEFDEFEKEVSSSIRDGVITQNPYYSICLAEKYLENSCNKSDRDLAKSELKHALRISKSSEIMYSAYIKLFEVDIEDGGQVLKRYARAVAKIFLVPIEKTCPDYKLNAVTNLLNASEALKIEHDYLEELLGGNKTTGKESALSPIITSNDLNIFLKHLQARLTCLATYKGNVESLIRQLLGDNEFESKSDTIGVDDGVIIAARVPRYLAKLESSNELKKHITDNAVNELEYIGTSSVYQLRKIHDVHEEVIEGAQVQIAGAISLLVSAAAFPVLLPVNAPLAGAMISEGITDIITALIQQGQAGFNRKDYIKGKVISYGITLATMGLSAIMNSTTILQKAVTACRNLATRLRAVGGPFAGICKFLANRLDQLAKYLEFMIEKIEFMRKTAAEQAKYLGHLKDTDKLKSFQQLQKVLKLSDKVITHGQQITQIVVQSAWGAIKGVVISVATERILIASLNNWMSGLKPVIQEKVEKLVRERIESRLKNVSSSALDEAIQASFDTEWDEDVKHVSKEIGLGIARHSSNWKMQLGALAFDSLLSGADISSCTSKMCDKFMEKLGKQANNPSEKSVPADVVILKISELITGVIYGKIVSITGKIAVTLPKVLYRGYKERQEKKADAKAIDAMEKKNSQIKAADEAAGLADSKCAHDAVSETLGLDETIGSKQLADASNLAASEQGASVEETKQLYEQNGIGVTTCGEEQAVAQFKTQESDRGVVCLSGGEGPGHVAAVTIENDQVMVSDGEQKITLDAYKEKYGFTQAEFIVPEGVNESTLPEVQHKCNLNRIVKATHPLGYVGQDDGDKLFGTQARIKTQVPSHVYTATTDMKIADAVEYHYEESAKEFNTLVENTAELKKKYPHVTISVKKGATYQQGEGRTDDQTKPTDINLNEASVDDCNRTQASHMVGGFTVVIEGARGDEGEDFAVLSNKIKESTAKTNILPSFVNQSKNLDRSKDEVGYDSFKSFVDKGCRGEDKSATVKSFVSQMKQNLDSNITSSEPATATVKSNSTATSFNSNSDALSNLSLRAKRGLEKFEES